MNYYNEIEPFAAAWLEQLMAADLIPFGYIDTRSIEDVRTSDLEGFTQCHFFAGIGVWPYALRQAGWADGRRIWTGSCPCQPFSAAGEGGGFTDKRHLWPAWFHLITTAKQNSVPIFGEQVSGKRVGPWIDLVQTDLEGIGHAFGIVDSPSAGYGAPHIRQRINWLATWVGDATRGRCRVVGDAPRPGSGGHSHGTSNTLGRLAHADGGRARHEWEQRSGQQRLQSQNGSVGVVGVAHDARSQGRIVGWDGGNRQSLGPASMDDRPGPINGFWRDADWIGCRDDKWRPIEPGSFPLVNGTPARMGRLRGYGNAVNASQTTEFIKAAMMLFDNLEG